MPISTGLANHLRVWSTNFVNSSLIGSSLFTIYLSHSLFWKIRNKSLGGLTHVRTLCPNFEHWCAPMSNTFKSWFYKANVKDFTLFFDKKTQESLNFMFLLKWHCVRQDLYFGRQVFCSLPQLWFIIRIDMKTCPIPTRPTVSVNNINSSLKLTLIKINAQYILIEKISRNEINHKVYSARKQQWAHFRCSILGPSTCSNLGTRLIGLCPNVEHFSGNILPTSFSKIMKLTTWYSGITYILPNYAQNMNISMVKTNNT